MLVESRKVLQSAATILGKTKAELIEVFRLIPDSNYSNAELDRMLVHELQWLIFTRDLAHIVEKDTSNEQA